MKAGVRRKCSDVTQGGLVDSLKGNRLSRARGSRNLKGLQEVRVRDSSEEICAKKPGNRWSVANR